MISFVVSYMVLGGIAWGLSINYDGYNDGIERKRRRTVEYFFHSKHLWKLFLMIIIACAAAFLFNIYNYSLLKGLRYLCFLYGAMLIGNIDQKEKRIPNQIIIFLLFLRIFLLIIECLIYPAVASDFFIYALSGFVLGGAIFYIGYFLSKGGIGLGDVKLMAVAGAYLGASLMYTTAVIGLLCAACYGGVQMARKRLSIKDSVAFAPFIAIGAIITVLCGF